MVSDIGCVAIGLSIAAILHILVWRSAPSNSPRIFLIFILLFLGLCISLAASALTTGFNADAFLAVFSYSVLADVFYTFLYTVACRSVSMTLLIRMETLPNNRISLDQLAMEYASSARFDDRIHVMADSGWVEFKEGLAALTPRGVKVAKVARGISRFLSGGLEG